MPWFFHALDRQPLAARPELPGAAAHLRPVGLNRSLGLKSLDDRDDLPIYGSQPRVAIRPHSRETDRIRILVHDRREVTTAGFRQFLRVAVRRHLELVRGLARNVAKAQPWRVDGKAWHLSQKGIAPAQPPQWQPMTLVELLGRLTRGVPGATVDWSRKSTVLVLTRDGRVLARVASTLRPGLRVSVPVPVGRFTPTAVEGLGLQPRVVTANNRAQVEFWLSSPNQLAAAALARLLAGVAPESAGQED
ncbi:MAG: hypothetical protein U1A27_13490 [Phycisphaerae bacterium]